MNRMSSFQRYYEDHALCFLIAGDVHVPWQEARRQSGSSVILEAFCVVYETVVT